ncbi:MAG: hypothetical protein WKG01_31390 [Kofleriaceae bacterium]
MKAVIFLAVLAAGCKDKPKAQPPTAGSQAQPAGSAAPSRSGAPSRQVGLPKGTGKPPVRSTKRHGKATWDKLSKLTYADWEHDVRQLADNHVEIKHKTKARPKIGVTITASHCLDCPAMKLAAWQPKTDAMKQLSIPSPALRTRKDTVFELGETTLNGQPVIFTYQLGSSVAPDPDNENQPSGEYTDAYVLYFNDGLNQISVAAAYADDTRADVKAMTDLAPKEDLERVAKAFLDAFTQAW